MNTAFDEEEDLAPAQDKFQDEQDRELTLNSTTLLAIFFGLVLVCGLCFGLGFTLGKRSGTSVAEASAPVASAASQPVELHAKPSASSQDTVATEPVSADTSGNAASSDSSADSSNTLASAPGSTDGNASAPDAENSSPTPTHAANTSAETRPDQHQEPSPKQSATAVQSPKPSAAPAPQAQATGRFMVQVAAVSNPADAEVLIGALTKRGYTVAARHEPNDSFLHVQIGPLATHADAVAMRQKLLNDGYNAILK